MEGGKVVVRLFGHRFSFFFFGGGGLALEDALFESNLSLGQTLTGGQDGLVSAWGARSCLRAGGSVFALPCPAARLHGKTDHGGGSGSRAPHTCIF